MLTDSQLVGLVHGAAKGAIQPASVDVRLAPGLLRMSEGVWVDPMRGEMSPDTYGPVECRSDGSVRICPGGFLLGTTMERVTLPADIVGRVEGKSSLARLGLLPHAAGGFIDPGFEGEVTLEIANVGAGWIVLRPGMFIAQLAFMRCEMPAVRPYGSTGLGSHYQGQLGATAPRFDKATA